MFPDSSPEFTCAGDFDFFFFLRLALATVYARAFSLLYSQEMCNTESARLCRPSTNVNVRSTRRIYSRRAPVAIYSCSNSLYVSTAHTPAKVRIGRTNAIVCPRSDLSSDRKLLPLSPNLSRTDNLVEPFSPLAEAPPPHMVILL